MNTPKPFKLKMQTVPEKVVENAILHYLWYRKIFAWKVQTVGLYDAKKGVYRRSANPFHLKGVADIMGVIPGGRALAIEAKSAVGRPSPEQILFIEKINASGGLAFIARSVEDVEARLKLEGVIT